MAFSGGPLACPSCGAQVALDRRFDWRLPNSAGLYQCPICGSKFPGSDLIDVNRYERASRLVQNQIGLEALHEQGADIEALGLEAKRFSDFMRAHCYSNRGLAGCLILSGTFDEAACIISRYANFSGEEVLCVESVEAALRNLKQKRHLALDISGRTRIPGRVVFEVRNGEYLIVDEGGWPVASRSADSSGPSKPELQTYEAIRVPPHCWLHLAARGPFGLPGPHFSTRSEF